MPNNLFVPLRHNN